MITGPSNVPPDWNLRQHHPALTFSEVIRIRASSAKPRVLADTYGVSLRTIYRALQSGYAGIPRFCRQCGIVRTPRGICQGCLNATAGPLTVARLRELGLSA